MTTFGSPVAALRDNVIVIEKGIRIECPYSLINKMYPDNSIWNSL